MYSKATKFIILSLFVVCAFLLTLGAVILALDSTLEENASYGKEYSQEHLTK